ncbi:MAG: MurR/RpiR family transcriptional regulator [Bacillota bacterium]
MGQPEKEKSYILGTLLKLQGIYPSLRNAEKRVADYIAFHAGEVVYLSVTELAERSGSSEATVVRLCQRAGYRGFQDLKIAIAQDLVAPLKNIHEDVDERDSTQVVMQKVFAANIQALENTRAVLDADQLGKAVDALVSADTIAVIGVGTSGPIVLDCQYKLMRIGLRCQAYVDPHIQLLLVAQLGKNDLIMGISHSGSSREVVDVMRAAGEMGLRTMCVTGYPKSPITEVSEIRLHTSAPETKYRAEAIASRVAQLTITDILLVNVALRMKEKALAQIQRNDKLLLDRKF